MAAYHRKLKRESPALWTWTLDLKRMYCSAGFRRPRYQILLYQNREARPAGLHVYPGSALHQQNKHFPVWHFFSPTHFGRRCVKSILLALANANGRFSCHLTYRNREACPPASFNISTSRAIVSGSVAYGLLLPAVLPHYKQSTTVYIGRGVGATNRLS